MTDYKYINTTKQNYKVTAKLELTTNLNWSQVKNENEAEDKAKCNLLNMIEAGLISYDHIQVTKVEKTK